MALAKFDLVTVAEMDGGRIRSGWERLLKRLEDDCKDRPGMKAARKLVLTLFMEPVADGQDLESVNVSFDLKDTLPALESKNYNMQSVAGGLLFNDASPEEVRQRTLDMAPRPQRTKTEDVPKLHGKEAASGS